MPGQRSPPGCSTSSTCRHREPTRMTAPPEPDWTPVKVERMAVAPAVEQGVGMVLGLALAVVLIAEVYLDVVYVFGAGRVLRGSRSRSRRARARSGRPRPSAPGSGAGPWRARSAAPPSSPGSRSRRARGAAAPEVEPAPLAGLLAMLAGGARTAWAADRELKGPRPDRGARRTRAAVDPEPGEQIFFHGHPSWRSMLAFYVRGLLVAVVAGVLAGMVTRATGRQRRGRWVARGRARRVRARARAGAAQAAGRRPTRSPTGA